MANMSSEEYQAILDEVSTMIKQERIETRKAALKSAQLKIIAIHKEIAKLKEQIEKIELLKTDASNGNWKPIISIYAHDIYELDYEL
jgi:hypothetical protein